MRRHTTEDREMHLNMTSCKDEAMAKLSQLRAGRMLLVSPLQDGSPEASPHNEKLGMVAPGITRKAPSTRSCDGKGGSDDYDNANPFEIDEAEKSSREDPAEVVTEDGSTCGPSVEIDVRDQAEMTVIALPDWP